MKNKILIDLTPLDKGGGIQFSQRILKNYLKLDNTEFIIVLNKKIQSQFNFKDSLNIKSIHIFNKNFFFSKIFIGIRILFLVRRFNPLFIHTIFGPAYFLTKKTHIVGFAQESLLQDSKSYSMNIKSFFKRFLFSRYDILTVETEFFKKKIKDIYKYQKIILLKNTLNPDLINGSLAHNFEIPNDKIKIFIPSAYYKHKNLEIISDVIIDLKLNYNCILYFLFITDNKTFMQNFKKKLSTYNLEKFILDLGPQQITSMASLYYHSDIILLPSFSEVSSAVYPESFYFKKPLITSDLPFARDICKDAAIYINPYDFKDISSKIYDLLQNQNRQKLMIAKGQEIIKRYSTSSEIFQNFYLNVFKYKLNKKNIKY